MYHTVVTMCTSQWSLYVPQSGHCMYRTVVNICTTQWSLCVPHSGHYMYRTVVIMCTAQWSLHIPPSLTFTNSTFCPHSVFMCFVWISEQTATISLYSINWLVFITESECVYCAVRTGSLYKIRVNLVFSDPTMAQAVSRRPLRPETQVRSHASLCEICCGKWHFDRFFSQYFGFPLSVLSHQRSVIVCIYKLFLRKEETEAVLKCSEGSVLFEIGGIGQKNTPFFTWPCSERVSVWLLTVVPPCLSVCKRMAVRPANSIPVSRGLPRS